MTSPRAHLVDPERPAFYHVHTRCVRRAWLCGVDPVTGRSYEHRRAWIERRILFLAKYFSVEVFAYAVMSNHYHIVLRFDPAAPQSWTDTEVAERWLALTGPAACSPDDQVHSHRIHALASNPTKVTTIRQRLGSLSWFMRMLNHPIAFRANREDDCTGHFWEGRFKSTALLDEAAVLACMAYVDLNPVRAKVASHFRDSTHTSVKRRIDLGTKGSAVLGPIPLTTRVDGRSGPGLSITFSEYQRLLISTGLVTAVPPEADTTWRERVLSMALPQRAHGSRERLLAWFTRLGQSRFRAAALPRLATRS